MAGTGKTVAMRVVMKGMPDVGIRREVASADAQY